MSNEADDRLPQAVAEDTMTVLGHTLRVYVLDDGRRIIDAADVERFFGLAGEFEHVPDEPGGSDQPPASRRFRPAGEVTACGAERAAKRLPLPAACGRRR